LTSGFLGAKLARLALAEALRILARRGPTLRGDGPAPWKPMLGMTGPKHASVR